MVGEDMSHTLSCTFTLATERDPIYWWPLVFEAMHQHDFSFSSPDYGKGVSHYYYQRIGDPKDSDIVKGSFKRFWEEVYSERNEDLTAYFWSSDADYYNLSVSLQPVQENNQILLTVYFEGAEVISLPLQEAGERLFHVLECLETLYQTCKPCTGGAPEGVPEGFGGHCGDALCL